MTEYQPTRWLTWATYPHDGPPTRTKKPITISVTDADATDTGWEVPAHRSPDVLRIGDRLVAWRRNPHHPREGPHTQHLVEVVAHLYGPHTHPYLHYGLRWLVDVDPGAFDEEVPVD